PARASPHPHPYPTTLTPHPAPPTPHPRPASRHLPPAVRHTAPATQHQIPSTSTPTALTPRAAPRHQKLRAPGHPRALARRSKLLMPVDTTTRQAKMPASHRVLPTTTHTARMELGLPNPRRMEAHVLHLKARTEAERISVLHPRTNARMPTATKI